jgi:hypothetical protein
MKNVERREKEICRKKIKKGINNEAKVFHVS